MIIVYHDTRTRGNIEGIRLVSNRATFSDFYKESKLRDYQLNMSYAWSCLACIYFFVAHFLGCSIEKIMFS